MGVPPPGAASEAMTSTPYSPAKSRNNLRLMFRKSDGWPDSEGIHAWRRICKEKAPEDSLRRWTFRVKMA
jgi:hypothetical protein